MPAQQSVLEAHELPRARQVHTPPSQSSCPQHAVLLVHAVPTPWQHWRVVGEGSQRSPLQQSDAVVHVVSPRGRQVEARQVPEMHVVPAQHSLLSTHDCPSRWQAQRPVAVSQSM